ncbi:histidine kinase [Romboutsia weinsteinii]|uniref:histidine kinase n=1 Tax=Romboutsia weinsteinii TaxID=2020949 RepID=A0A371J127_9FIRM|nr:sensor histidine kinase [Romboutsia weinsteinii]RDY26378.1 histidine kinase [Romboutsia weinsteinii]
MNKCADKIYIFIVILFLLILGNVWEIYSLEKNDILFISSYNPNFISFDDQVSGLLDGIEEDINLQVEYMDSKIIGNDDNEEDFYNLLKYNLNNYKKFEAIIVGDDEALEFATKYRDDLFKDIPIVFFAVEDVEIIKEAFTYDMVSGVEEVESLESNIKLITTLHKNIKNISIISSNERELDNVLEALDENININKIITEDMTIDEFKKRLSVLDYDDAILIYYPSNFKDGYLSHQESTSLIKETTNNLPIYSTLGYGIDHGSIGGKVISHYHQGKKAGEIVKSILLGDKSKKVYVGKDEVNKYIFDYNEMKKFNIKRSNIPKGSIIVNDPLDFISKHRVLVFCIIVFFIGLIGIIIALIFYVNYRIKYEKMLVKAIKESNEANRLKSYFISNITHELRTPITVIMSVIQLVKSNHKDEKYLLDSNNYDLIDINCNRLLRLINNVIDVDKFESGNMNLNLRNINIVEFIENIVSSVIPYVKAKDLEIIFDTTDEDIIMAVDSDKIERIVLNLVSNAIKFSKDSGLINVNVSRINNSLRFTVSDDGIGIEEKYIEKIFDRFVQLDNTMTRKNEGSGIGLSIVQSFVNLHNGSINIDSEINIGTTFTVDIPIMIIDENTESTKLYIEEITENTKIAFSDIY